MNDCGHCDENGYETAVRGGPPWTFVRITHAEADRRRLAASRRKLEKLAALPVELRAFQYVAVLTPWKRAPLEAADRAVLTAELRARLAAAVPTAELLVGDDGATVWAAVRGVDAADETAEVYWPVVHAIRAAVLASIGDLRVGIGHYHSRDLAEMFAPGELPPPLL